MTIALHAHPDSVTHCEYLIVAVPYHVANSSGAFIVGTHVSEFVHSMFSSKCPFAEIWGLAGSQNHGEVGRWHGPWDIDANARRKRRGPDRGHTGDAIPPLRGL